MSDFERTDEVIDDDSLLRILASGHGVIEVDAGEYRREAAGWRFWRYLDEATA